MLQSECATMQYYLVHSFNLSIGLRMANWGETILNVEGSAHILEYFLWELHSVVKDDHPMDTKPIYDIFLHKLPFNSICDSCNSFKFDAFEK